MNLSYSTAHKIPKGLWKINCNKICFGRRGAIKVNESQISWDSRVKLRY